MRRRWTPARLALALVLALALLAAARGDPDALARRFAADTTGDAAALRKEIQELKGVSAAIDRDHHLEVKAEVRQWKEKRELARTLEAVKAKEKVFKERDAKAAERLRRKRFAAQVKQTRRWVASARGVEVRLDYSQDHCLAVAGRLAPRSRVRLEKCHRRRHSQKWVLLPDRTVRPRHAPHLCLDLNRAQARNGNFVQLAGCARGRRWAIPSQGWQFDGKMLRFFRNRRFALDVAGARLRVNQRVHLWRAYNNRAQRWRLAKPRDRRPRPHAVSLHLTRDARWCLGTHGNGRPRNGVPVVARQCQPGNRRQMWRRYADGSWRSEDDLSYCLDLSGGRREAGRRLQLWDCTVNGAQRWRYDGDQLRLVVSGAWGFELFKNRARDNTPFVLARMNNGAVAQKLALVPATRARPREVRLAYSDDFCLGARGGRARHGAGLSIEPCAPRRRRDQKWLLFPDRSMRPRANLALCVDLRGGAARNGGVLSLRACASHGRWASRAQSWVRSGASLRFFGDRRFVIDVAGARLRPGQPLHLWQWLNNRAQRWIVARGRAPRRAPRPVALTVGRSAGWCLSLYRNGAPRNGLPVVTRRCAPNNPRQQWRRYSDGTWRNAANVGFCLDLSGGRLARGQKLQVWDCMVNGNQRWRHDRRRLRLARSAGWAFELRGNRLAADTPYVLGTASGSAAQHLVPRKPLTSAPVEMRLLYSDDYCMTPAGGRARHGARVRLERCGGPRRRDQQWRLLPDRSVRPVASMALCLDLANGRVAAGNQVRLWKCAASKHGVAPAQQWAFDGTALRYYRNQRFVVDVSGARLRHGQPLHLWTWINNRAQRWVASPPRAARRAPPPVLLRLAQSQAWCLGTLGDRAPRNGLPVVARRCVAGRKTQQWRHYPDHTWRNAANPDLCLDVHAGITRAGNKLQVWQCYVNQNQRWRFDGDQMRFLRSMAWAFELRGNRLAADTPFVMGRVNSRKAAQKLVLSPSSAAAARRLLKGGRPVEVRLEYSDDHCLGVRGGRVRHGATLGLDKCRPGGAGRRRDQLWRFLGDGSVRPAANTRLCLDVPGARARNNNGPRLVACRRKGRAAVTSQRWRFDGVGVRLAANPAFVLDVAGGRVRRNQPVRLWQTYNNHAQRWRVASPRDRRFAPAPRELRLSADRRWCLGLDSNAAPRNGVRAAARRCADGNVRAQWRVYPDGTVRSAADPSYCLDLHAGRTTPGNRVQVWDCTANRNQRWLFDGARVRWTASRAFAMELAAAGAADNVNFVIGRAAGGARARRQVLRPQAPRPPRAAGRPFPVRMAYRGRFCVSVGGRGVRNGAPLVTRACSRRLRALQEWRSFSDGTLRLQANHAYCAELPGGRAPRGSGTAPLRLARCSAVNVNGQQFAAARRDATVRLAAFGGHALQTGPGAGAAARENLQVVLARAAAGRSAQAMLFGARPVAAGRPLEVRLAYSDDFCLGARGGRVRAGTQVSTERCDRRRRDQLWLFLSDRSVRPVANRNMCLDLRGATARNGNRLALFPCSSQGRWASAAQGWVRQGPAVRFHRNRRFVIDVAGARLRHGQPLHLWPWLNNRAQRWRVVPRGTPRNPPRPSALRVARDRTWCLGLLRNAKPRNGLPVVARKCAVGDRRQQWRRYPDGSVRNEADVSYCLDVHAGQRREGNRLQVWDCTVNNNQRWRFDGDHVRWMRDPAWAFELRGNRLAVDTPFVFARAVVRKAAQQLVMVPAVTPPGTAPHPSKLGASSLRWAGRRYGAELAAGVNTWRAIGRGAAVRQVPRFGGQYVEVLPRSRGGGASLDRVVLEPNTRYVVTLRGRGAGSAATVCPFVRDSRGRPLTPAACTAKTALGAGTGADGDAEVRVPFRTGGGSAVIVSVGAAALGGTVTAADAFFVKSLDVVALSGAHAKAPALAAGAYRWVPNQKTALEAVDGAFVRVTNQQDTSTPGVRMNNVQLRPNTGYRLVLVGQLANGRRPYRVCPWVAQQGRRGNVLWRCGSDADSLGVGETTLSVDFKTDSSGSGYSVGALFSGARKGEAFLLKSLHLERAPGGWRDAAWRGVGPAPIGGATVQLAAGLGRFVANQRVRIAQAGHGGQNYVRVETRQNGNSPGIRQDGVSLTAGRRYEVRLVGRLDPSGPRGAGTRVCPWVDNGRGRDIVWSCDASRSLKAGDADTEVRVRFQAPQLVSGTFRVGALFNDPRVGDAFLLKALEIVPVDGGNADAPPVFDAGVYAWRGNQRVAVRHVSAAGENFVRVVNRQRGSTPGVRLNNVVLEPNTKYRLTVVGRRTSPRRFRACAWVSGLSWRCNDATSLGTQLTRVSVDFRSRAETGGHSVGVLFSGAAPGDSFDVLSFRVERAASRSVSPVRAVGPASRRLAGGRATVDFSAGFRGWFPNQRVAFTQVSAFGGTYVRVTSRQRGSSPGMATYVSLRPNTRYVVTLTGQMTRGNARRGVKVCPWVDLRGKDLVWACSRARSLGEGMDTTVRVPFTTPGHGGSAARFRAGALFSSPRVGAQFFLKSFDITEARAGAAPTVWAGAYQWRPNQNVQVSYQREGGRNEVVVRSRQRGSSPGLRMNGVTLRPRANYRIVVTGRKLTTTKVDVCPWVADSRGKDLAWACRDARSLTTGDTVVSVEFTTGAQGTGHSVGVLFSNPVKGDAFAVTSVHIETR